MKVSPAIIFKLTEPFFLKTSFEASGSFLHWKKINEDDFLRALLI